MQIPEEIHMAPTPVIASHRLSVRLQNGLPLPLYPEDEDGDEGAQEASMMTTPKKSNASLTNSFATMLSNYASFSTVSPKQHEESIDTFFPPPTPERQKSQPDMPTENVEDSCCAAEDHWASCATSSSRKDSLKFPPIVPSRLASLEPAPANSKTRQE